MFNDFDYIPVTEFTCEQEYANFVYATKDAGYPVHLPNYQMDIVSKEFSSIMFFEGEWSASNFLEGDKIDLEAVMNKLNEE